MCWVKEQRPVRHGKVFDPTLANEKWKVKDPTGKGIASKGEYLGIEVPKEEIAKYQLRTKHYSYLSHAREDESLMKKIWK